ncbi:MAG: hypothetical protein ABIP19_03205 [Dermatophilaceae bacterium]
MNPKRWAPVAAVAAVLAVLVGVSFFSNRGGVAAGPPMLRLATADASFAASNVNGRGSYRLTGTLPDGPSEARLRDLPARAVSEAAVRALAVALGETAAPVRAGGTWTSGDLVVQDQPGNPWTWGVSCGPDTPVSSDAGTANDFGTSICVYGAAPAGDPPSAGGSSGGTSSSGTSSSSSGSIAPLSGSDPFAGTGSRGGTAPPRTVGACPSQPAGAELVACNEPGVPLAEPLPPKKVLLTESQALAATARIRDALGRGDDPTRVEGLSVVVEPVAGGLQTNGFATVLQLSARATLVSASGSLSTGQEGDSYPLRSARKAFDDIPVVALGAPCDAAGCPEGPVITGARLGLSRVALDKGAAALVPAWLFTVQGSAVPLVALAVADEFLSRPEPSSPSPGAPPATDPGMEPSPDRSVPPRPSSGKPADPTGREPFGFDAAYADSNPKVLVVRYGDSGSCPSQGVRHDVVQDPGRVVVTLTRAAMRADLPCTSDYRAVLVRVALNAPLGTREVVDGFRGEPVAISKGSTPLG